MTSTMRFLAAVFLILSLSAIAAVFVAACIFLESI
jgi:hypothetical protein